MIYFLMNEKIGNEKRERAREKTEKCTSERTSLENTRKKNKKI